MLNFLLQHPAWFALNPHRFQLGESPRFAHGQLRWVDIQARRLMIAREISGHHWPRDALQFESIEMPDQMACILPSTDPACWLGFGRMGIWLIRDGQAPEKILDAPYDNSRIRFNDACCDEWGRIWVSSLVDDKKTAEGKLYCYAKGVLHDVLGNITTGNGMAYSSAYKKLWLADTTAKRICNYTLSQTDSHIAPAGLAHQYITGTERPDGACMITPEHYAVAVIDGYRLDVFSAATDTLQGSIHAPFNKITMPCMVQLDQGYLILTSAQTQEPVRTQNTSEQYLQSGSLIAQAVCAPQAETFVYEF
jgi:sugar lactone lactonase YvrE